MNSAPGGKGKALSAVVLGASSQGGTGWACAELLASQNANVVVGARTLSGVEKLADRIRGTACRCDASVEEDVAAMAALAEATNGKIDIAIIAAGAPFVASIDECSQQTLAEATAINYFGPFYFIKHMARHMADNGSIVIISSLSADRALPGLAAYACAKGACTTLVKYGALEYAHRGIRVNAIVAGVLETPLNAGMRTPESGDAWQTLMKEIPLRRAVQPEQIAHSCLWLSSPQCAITGESIFIDNGNHLLRAAQPEEMPSGLMEDNAELTGYVLKEPSSPP